MSGTVHYYRVGVIIMYMLGTSLWQGYSCQPGNSAPTTALGAAVGSGGMTVGPCGGFGPVWSGGTEKLSVDAGTSMEILLLPGIDAS